MLIGVLYILFGEMSIQVFGQFLIWVFLLLLLSFWSSLYILDISSFFSIYMMCRCFFPVNCLFLMNRFLILMKSNLSIFSFVTCVSGVTSKKSLSDPISWSLPSVFSSQNFIVLDLMLNSLIHFKLIFLYVIR